jgi:anti-sigma regulatory factor (Ser/Thr protein kinase)
MVDVGQPGGDHVPAESDVPGGERVLSLALTARVEELPRVRAAVREVAERESVQSPEDVVVAVGEACTNVIHHAYSGRRRQMEISAFRTHQGLVVVVRDYGRGLPPRPTMDRFGFRLMDGLARGLTFRHRDPGLEVRMLFPRRPPA